MIDTPTLVHTAPQHIARIHLTIPRADIQKVMGPGIGEVHRVLAEQGIAPTGPWLTHHHQMTAENFDFDIAVPVATPVQPSGRVTPGILPAARVARTVYHGGYEGLSGGWGELMAWMAAQGLTPAADLWERYLVGPESSPNPADWQSELNRPIAG